MSRVIDWDSLRPIWETTPDVLGAWAFGSARDGQLRDGGDVDVGILMANPPTFDDQLALLGRLQDALALDEVDLVVLNDAHVILRFEAVSGRRLFTRDLSALAEFVSLTAREYEDAMALYQRGLRWRAELSQKRAGTAEPVQRP
jgi:predicted nucleotidyltransferase